MQPDEQTPRQGQWLVENYFRRLSMECSANNLLAAVRRTARCGFASLHCTYIVHLDHKLASQDMRTRSSCSTVPPA